MDAIDSACDSAGLTNDSVRRFIRQWAAHTGASAFEVVSAGDDARLIREALAAGEIFPVAGERYYARSNPKDTARSEERTFVATSRPEDHGVYNNWRQTSDLRPLVEGLMAGASRGKTMYVVPYLMSPQGSPLERWAAGVQLTDSRVVVLHMIRMARVGVDRVNRLADPADFVRGVHVTGEIERLEHGTHHDKRYFVTIADERLLLHFGSSYGGNALLGKIAHGLRQAAYDGYVSGRFLAEQFMLIGVRDRQTGVTSYIAGGFPSASGKTNLAMMVPPPALAERYEVHFLGDDIAWLYVNPDDGRIYALNPEYGVFGVAKDTNAGSNPNAMAAIGAGSGALFTNTSYNPEREDVWWEGKTPEPPQDVAGWIDWQGEPIAARTPARRRSEASGDEWAHPNSRFTTALTNVPNLSPEASNPQGVPLAAIIFGGRVRDREPLVRALTNAADGVYDGLTLGAEATFAAEGKQGVLRYDPMSMRPFMSYGEAAYARHWLDLLGRASKPPVFAHVNWFQRDADGRYVWPGYAENLRPLLWLLDVVEGRGRGRETPIGLIPTPGALNLEGLRIAKADLERLLAYDAEAWQREIESREEHLAQFEGLPQEIWQAHRRLADAVRSDAARPA